MKKAFAIVVVCLAILFGAIFGFKAFVNRMMHKAMSHAPAPVFSVNAAKAAEQAWHPEYQAVASLSAVKGTAISTQIAGNVTAIHFHSGEEVPAGALLAQIDNTNELAQLATDQANLHLATINLRRTRRLMATRAASQSQLDSAQAAFSADQALVQNDHATLHKLAIRAPFSGHLGIRKVSLGQYLIPGTEIVDLQAWNPLHVDFTLPQSDLAQLHAGTPVQFTSNATGSQVFHGTITALGSAVSTSTRQVQVQATLSNPHNILRPGMFGGAVVVQHAVEHVVTVPVSAISYNTYGDYVYVVHSEKRNGRTLQLATQRIVRPGDSRNGQVAILSGLKAGETVVTEGQVKLSNNRQVRIEHSGKA